MVGIVGGVNKTLVFTCNLWAKVKTAVNQLLTQRREITIHRTRLNKYLSWPSCFLDGKLKSNINHCTNLTTLVTDAGIQINDLKLINHSFGKYYDD